MNDDELIKKVAEYINDAYNSHSSDEIDEWAESIVLLVQSNHDEEIRKLKSMCKAAAAEIDSQWAAHCDDDGYGPSNLMSRLDGRLSPDLYLAYDAPPKVEP